MPDPHAKAEVIGRLLADAPSNGYAWLREAVQARREALRQEIAWIEALCSTLDQPAPSSDCAADAPRTGFPGDTTPPHGPAGKPANQRLPGEAEVVAATVELFLAEGITTDEDALGRADVAAKIAERLGETGGVVISDKYLDRVGGALSRESRRSNPQVVNVGTPTHARYCLPTAGERVAGEAVPGGDAMARGDGGDEGRHQEDGSHDGAAMASHVAADHGVADHRQGRHPQRQSARPKRH